MTNQIKRKRKKLKKNAGELVVSAQLEKAGVEHTFEPHSFQYDIPATYTPDFVMTGKKGPIYVEVKGHHKGMAQWFSKIKHFVAANPDIDYRIVFLDAKKKFNKRYKSNLGDAADRLNIRWSDEGKVPNDWIK